MATDMTQTGGAREKKSHWLIAGLIIALIGIGISIYSTMHHIEVKATGKTDAACNINEQFSCDDVALSQFSEIGGIPLGVFGLGYFVASAVLLLVGLVGGKSSKEHLHGYIVMVGIGVISSVVLGYISATQVGSFCITCMIVYGLTGLQALSLVIWRADLPTNFSIKSIASGGTTAVIAVAAVILVFNFAKPMLTPDVTPEQAERAKAVNQVLSQTSQEIPISRSAYSGLGEDYRKGSDSAKVVITEFADFQCPACARMSENLSALSREYGDRIQVVFRNYPLDSSCNSSVQARIHESACRAAVLARCAGQYGKFWQFHDSVFMNQRSISLTNLEKWGSDIGLTPEQMKQCIDSKDIMDKVKEDIALGNQLGVDSTPTVFINGRKLMGGRGMNDLKNEIDQILAN